MHDVTTLDLDIDILGANQKLADENKQLLDKYNVKAIDLMGSIGSGKTLLAEKTIDILKTRGIRCGAIAGDVSGEDDYRRYQSHDIPVLNINTGKDCHLTGHLIQHSIKKIDLEKIDVLFIENVGNLVCPADFPLGSDKKVTVVSVTEGDDMVRKHPVLMGMSDIIVVNKIGLAEVMEVDIQRFNEDASEINPHVPVIFTDAKTGEGLELLLQKLGLI